MGEVGDEAKLQHAHQFTVRLYHCQLIVRVSLNGGKGLLIIFVKRLGGIFSASSQLVIGQQVNQRAKIISICLPIV